MLSSPKRTRPAGAAQPLPGSSCGIGAYERSAWAIPLLVCLAVILTFLPALRNDFVNWDDRFNILHNDNYRGFDWPRLVWMFSTFHAGHYHPLTWMSLAFDHALWGTAPLGYHLTSLLLHTANALLFYFIALRLLSVSPSAPSRPADPAPRLAAALAALLFALHPLRVESVAWATERRGVLSAFFYLSSILAYLTARSSGAKTRRWTGLSLAAFALALLSKVSVLTLPFVLIILDIFPLRRLHGPPYSWLSDNRRKVLLEKLYYLVPAFICGVIGIFAQSQADAIRPAAEQTPAAHFFLPMFSLAFYLLKTIWPVNLSPLYERAVPFDPWSAPFIFSAVVVLSVTAGAIALRRRRPGLAAGWAYYLLTALPVSGIIMYGDQLAADRYTYISGLAWPLLVSAGALKARDFMPAAGRRMMTLFFCGALALLSFLTLGQIRIWHDSESLWRQALSVNPRSGVAHENLGEILLERGQKDAAAGQYLLALAANPNLPGPHNNLGNILLRRGKPVEAIAHYRQALLADPLFADAHLNWGAALAGQGRPAEAVRHYQKALEISPLFAQAHLNLGAALGNLGRPAEAAEHLRKALKLLPGSAEIHFNLGLALEGQGLPQEATEHYREALRLRPDDMEAWNKLMALDSSTLR